MVAGARICVAACTRMLSIGCSENTPAEALGVTSGYSAHSMRTTFATTALENAASIEEVQYAMGHADVSTTKLYDRRGHNPEKAAAFFANY